jgi:hypothetical protein
MRAIASKTELCAEIAKRASTCGLQVRVEGDVLIGEMESIRAKWLLGGRKVSYRMSCTPNEADHSLRFREVVIERSWGIPPPTLTVEKTTVRGWRRSGKRTDVSVGGGGLLNYATLREAVEKTTLAAGWTFQLEGGRWPEARCP